MEGEVRRAVAVAQAAAALRVPMLQAPTLPLPKGPVPTAMSPARQPARTRTRQSPVHPALARPNRAWTVQSIAAARQN